MTNKRMERRQPFHQECFLSNGFGKIQTQTVDVSKMGVGLLIIGSLPFETGDQMSVDINSIEFCSKVSVQWTRKDVKNKATRVGLKLFSSLYDI